MELKKVAELDVMEMSDRVNVADALLKNGYVVKFGRRKRSATGKSYIYTVVVYRETGGCE